MCPSKPWRPGLQAEQYSRRQCVHAQMHAHAHKSYLCVKKPHFLARGTHSQVILRLVTFLALQYFHRGWKFPIRRQQEKFLFSSISEKLKTRNQVGLYTHTHTRTKSAHTHTHSPSLAGPFCSHSSVQEFFIVPCPVFLAVHACDVIPVEHPTPCSPLKFPGFLCVCMCVYRTIT